MYDNRSLPIKAETALFGDYRPFNSYARKLLLFSSTPISIATQKHVQTMTAVAYINDCRCGDSTKRDTVGHHACETISCRSDKHHQLRRPDHEATCLTEWQLWQPVIVG